jgi:hypothetical protein
MTTYADVLQKYVGAAGKLTRFKGDYSRFRVAFKVDDKEIVKQMQKQGAELFTLIEVGEDFVGFQSASAKIFLPIHTLVLED